MRQVVYGLRGVEERSLRTDLWKTEDDDEEL